MSSASHSHPECPVCIAHSSPSTSGKKRNGILMKLSALLLSVNIAASLPIAFCQMAPAAEEGVADTGDWLKSNLASIKKGKADIPTSRLKVTIPEKISSGDKKEQDG